MNPTLSEAIEAACDIAAERYANGLDTTAIDADVDNLVAIHEATMSAGVTLTPAQVADGRERAAAISLHALAPEDRAIVARGIVYSV